MELKELQAYWYQRLKEDGFKDIEDSKTGMIKEWSMNVFVVKTINARRRRERLEGQQRYYELAGQFMYTQTFKGLIKKPHYETVWQMHVDGIPFSKISKSVGIHLMTVFGIIKRIRAVMLSYDWGEDEDKNDPQ